MILYQDLKIMNDFNTPNSLLTFKQASYQHNLSTEIYEKEHFGYKSSELLNFTGFEEIYLIRLWDPDNLRPTTPDLALSAGKRSMSDYWNAGIILSKKLLLRISLLSNTSWTINVALDNIFNSSVHVTQRNTAIYTSNKGNIINESSINSFNEYISAASRAPGITWALDPGISSAYSDTSINYIMIDKSEVYEITINVGQTEITGILPSTHPGAANNEGVKVIILCKKVI